MSISNEERRTLSKLLIHGLETERQFLWDISTQNGEGEPSEQEKKEHNRKCDAVEKILSSWGLMIPKSVKRFHVEIESDQSKIDKRIKDKIKFRR